MVKPRIFIGSSVEGLDIAYAIQENLDFSATVTIWDQGIFNLTNTALDDLIATLQNTDFGIFVFSPDDISKIRDKNYKVTRDNVIFELGLFIGYLGKNRVSFVIPRNTIDFHLPSDLTGILPGEFNNDRPDGNLNAALGPFCNKIKGIIKKISIIELSEFKDENKSVKKIVIEKPDYWEFLLTMELLKSKISLLKNEVYEIENNLFLAPSKMMNGKEFINWISELNNDYQNLIKSFVTNYNQLHKAWGEPGIAGDELEIKKVIDRMIYYSNKSLEIEKSIKGIMPPEKISDLKDYISGWSSTIIENIFEFYDRLFSYFGNGKIPEGDLDFYMTLKVPDNIGAFNDRIEYYRSILPDIINDLDWK